MIINYLVRTSRATRWVEDANACAFREFAYNRPLKRFSKSTPGSPRMKKIGLGCLCLLQISLLLTAQENPNQRSTITLRDGWALQSSAKVDEPGEVISTLKFQPKDWYAVSVPTTVSAALVKAKVYPDPTFGMNLRSLPGVTYPV